MQSFLDAKTDKGLRVFIVGDSVLNAKSSELFFSGQIYSLGSRLMILLLIVALLFNSVKAGLLVTGFSVTQILVLFGTMGHFGITLDATTSMIAAIAVGIGIDNSLHFLMRYQNHLTRNTDCLQAISDTVKDEFTPIAVSGLILIAGFAVLCFSEFVPVVNFGLLCGLSIIVAFILNLVVLPVLLSMIQLQNTWQQLTDSLQSEFNSGFSLFRGLQLAQVKRMLSMGCIIELTAGQSVAPQKSGKELLLVVLQGSLQLQTVEPGPQQRNTVKTEGVMTKGAVTVIDGGLLNQVVALKPAKVLFFERKRLQRQAVFNPGLVCALISTFFCNSALSENLQETSSET